jgi:hypothetical protein
MSRYVSINLESNKETQCNWLGVGFKWIAHFFAAATLFYVATLWFRIRALPFIQKVWGFTAVIAAIMTFLFYVGCHRVAPRATVLA